MQTSDHQLGHAYSRRADLEEVLEEAAARARAFAKEHPWRGGIWTPEGIYTFDPETGKSILIHPPGVRPPEDTPFMAPSIP